MDSISSNIITFLIGVVTGAARTYFAERFTDRRREKEATRRSRDDFAKRAKTMPDLFREMKADLRNTPFGRDFVVLHEGEQPSPLLDSFFYSETSENEYIAKARILENDGYIADIGVGNVQKFRMREHFVEALRNWMPDGESEPTS